MATITEVEYLIIGAGPAGLQLAYFLEQAERTYLVLERGKSPGGFFKKFPRHRELISINKVETGYDDPELWLRWDWNSLLSDDLTMRFTRWTDAYLPSAHKLVDYLSAYAQHFNLKVQYEARIPSRGIRKINGQFQVTDTKGRRYACQHLIVATGVTKPYIPPIPGIELAEQYESVPLRPEKFRGKRVLIIGKGNSALETARTLIGTTSLLYLLSPTPLTLAYHTRFVGNVRSHLLGVVDTYLLKLQNVLLDAQLLGLRRSENGQKIIASVHYTHAANELEDLEFDRVIACMGFRFDATIFDESCRPALAIHDRFPAQTSAWESTNIPGLYFAGTLMQVLDFKKKQSAFIHGFRYNVAALFHILEKRYHGQSWPSTELAATPENLTSNVLVRLNRASGPFQQTDFIGDVIQLNTEGTAARYYEDVPLLYLSDDASLNVGHYFTATLAFGLDRILSSPNPLAIDRIHKDDVDQAAESTGIHPIIRHYFNGHLLSTHHVIEDIASEWKEEVHIQPLQAYFAHELAQVPLPQRVS